MEMENKLPREEITLDEKLHETKVKFLNKNFPALDPLMCSVLLKTPDDLLKKLIEDPKMWIIQDKTETLLFNMVSVSDPIDNEKSPRSVLENNN